LWEFGKHFSILEDSTLRMNFERKVDGVLMGFIRKAFESLENMGKLVFSMLKRINSNIE